MVDEYRAQISSTSVTRLRRSIPFGFVPSVFNGFAYAERIAAD